MENYPEHIYRTLPKDGDGETFRLQQTCDALQKLENEAKHYEAPVLGSLLVHHWERLG